MTSSLDCAAILFDLDGVLVNSIACVEATWRRWALRHGLDPERVIHVAHGRPTIETIRLLAPHLSADDEGARLEGTEAMTTEGVFEVPGARELLLGLPPRAWAIVTSATRVLATVRIRHTRLPMPDVLICADEIERGKPDPEGYLTAAARICVGPMDCVVVEDSPAGLEAARAAGMRSLGVIGTYPEDALTAADFLVSRLDELFVTSHGYLLRLVLRAQ